MTYQGIPYSVEFDERDGWKQTVDGQVIGWMNAEADAVADCKRYIEDLIVWRARTAT